MKITWKVITTEELVREIRRRNSAATMEDIGRVIGISKQAVHQHLRKVEPRVRAPLYSEEGCQETLGRDGKCAVCGWNSNTRSYDPIASPSGPKP